ncbi:VOC family protein [Arcobacter sp. YIC-464]|uniref:VOC family protein n=1 Tax=Arcobacter sp. YIC-464 TaxID=3376631 RepID=UPI003C1C574C
MRFAHTNIAARDWKSLADFYINVFECKIKPPQRDLRGEWLDKAIGIKNARQMGVHLTLPGFEKNAPTLEIFSYEEFVDTNPIMANHIGFTHIAFEVEDVDATMQKALDNGATKLGEVIENKIEGVGMLKFTYLRDIEGNIIEIQSWN